MQKELISAGWLLGAILIVIAIVGGYLWYDYKNPCVAWETHLCTTTTCANEIVGETPVCLRWETRNYPCRECIQRVPRNTPFPVEAL